MRQCQKTPEPRFFGTAKRFHSAPRIRAAYGSTQGDDQDVVTIMADGIAGTGIGKRGNVIHEQNVFLGHGHQFLGRNNTILQEVLHQCTEIALHFKCVSPRARGITAKFTCA